mmetsp:Transcript_2691/g.10521  ORF Transcript_2691/g.10521 Transcript_2691/m.10521 type:complete len:215 (-) Transcript_2691:1127-1771(-)
MLGPDEARRSASRSAGYPAALLTPACASASLAASASSDARRLGPRLDEGDVDALAAVGESTPACPFPFPPWSAPTPPGFLPGFLPSPDLLAPDTPMLPMELSMLLLAVRIMPDGDLSSDEPDAFGGAVPAGRTGMGTGAGGGAGGSKAPSDSKPSSVRPVEGAPGMFTPPEESPPAESPPVASSGRSQRHSRQSCPTLPNRSVTARSSVTRRSS